MWPVAILLIAVVEFYWFALMGTIWCWLCAIIDLCQGKFTRAAIWFSLGLGGLWWWMGTEGVDFDKWLHASYGIVSLGALATFARFYNRHRRAAQAVTPFEPAPFEPTPVVVNININIDPRADSRAVHAELVAIASALRGAVGARRISGPTVN
jgi:hypothetical protein